MKISWILPKKKYGLKTLVVLVLQNLLAGFILSLKFESSIGSIKADFDKNGNLTSTFQRFKNVQLPDDRRLKILQNYKNSKVVNNNHILTTKDCLIDKEFYKVKIL